MRADDEGAAGALDRPEPISGGRTRVMSATRGERGGVDVGDIVRTVVMSAGRLLRGSTALAGALTSGDELRAGAVDAVGGRMAVMACGLLLTFSS